MLSKVKPVHIFLGAMAVWIISLFWARTGLGVALVFAASLWGGNIKGKLKDFFSNKYYLSITAIFLLLLLTGLYSENTAYFIKKMRYKLPFLVLPFAFSAVKGLGRKEIKWIMMFTILVALTGVLWSIGYFLTDASGYIESYGRGHTLPTPGNHVRFSILISLAVCMCIHLQRGLQLSGEKYLYIIVAVFFATYLHLLAVRSGLMCFYVLIFCYLVFNLFQRGNKKMFFGVATLACLAIFLSINFLPTVKNKINYTIYSLKLFAKNENIRELSDSGRLGSLAAGIHIAKENPIIGVGYGDIKDETDSYFLAHYPDLYNLGLMPHNQYLLILASAGILGLLGFLWCTIFPIFYLGGNRDFFFVSSQLMLFASFMVEHTIETQLGISVYLFIVLIALKNMESSNSNIEHK